MSRLAAEAPRWLDGRVLGAREPLPAFAAPGVFETVRAEQGALFFLRAHCARFERGARALDLSWPPPWDPVAALFDVTRALGPAAAALRLTWAPPHLAVVARALDPPPQAVEAWLAAPGRVALPRPFGVKTTARAAYDALRAEALARGAFEVLVRAADGELVEGTITNLFVAAAGELATPPLASGALPGIVRAAILTELEQVPLVDDRGRSWAVRERVLTASDLARAEEVLLSNSILRVVGLARLTGLREDLPGARGPLARALLARSVRLESATRDCGTIRPEPH